VERATGRGCEGVGCGGVVRWSGVRGGQAKSQKNMKQIFIF